MRRYALAISLVCSLCLASAVGAQQGNASRRPLAASQQTLLASAARTASGTSTAVTGLSAYTQAEFALVVSAAATEAGDTLDVVIQKSPDGGTTWTDFIHFTQILGNGGAKTFFAGWREAAPENEEWAAQDGTSSANTQRTGMMGDTLRIKWTVVDVATADNQSFTFKVVALFKE